MKPLLLLFLLLGAPAKEPARMLQPLYKITRLNNLCEAGNNNEIYPPAFGKYVFGAIHYDKGLRPVQMMASIFPSGSNEWPFTLKLFYDKNNLLSSIQEFAKIDGPTPTFTATYTLTHKVTATGKIITIKKKDETKPGEQPVLLRSLVYNKLGQLIRQFKPGTFYNDYTYHYNKNGDVTRIYESGGENQPKILRWEYLSYDSRPNPANFSSNILALLSGVYSKHNPTKYIFHRNGPNSPVDYPIERSLSYTYENGIPVKFDVTGFEIQLTDQAKLPLEKKGVSYCSFTVN